MANPRTGNEGGTSTEQETRVKTQRPKLFKVLLHNDNFTTMEFVVQILMEIFNHGENDAVAIMLAVHKNGVGIAGMYTYEIAETKSAKVLRMAQEEGFPLLCTMEPET